MEPAMSDETRDNIEDWIDGIGTEPNPEFIHIPHRSNRKDQRRRERARRRHTVSADALLSLEEVVEQLGGRAGDVRPWVAQNVRPLRHPSGRKVYRWGDVIETMRGVAA